MTEALRSPLWQEWDKAGSRHTPHWRQGFLTDEAAITCYCQTSLLSIGVPSSFVVTPLSSGEMAMGYLWAFISGRRWQCPARLLFCSPTGGRSPYVGCVRPPLCIKHFPPFAGVGTIQRAFYPERISSLAPVTLLTPRCSSSCWRHAMLVVFHMHHSAHPSVLKNDSKKYTYTKNTVT